MTTAPASNAAIVAVIVTYNPDVSRLTAIIKALATAVNRIAIVDNASAELDCNALADASPMLVIRRLAENRGIGAAQNEGVAIARSFGAHYILFLDQDSVPGMAMVASLVSALGDLARHGERVACIGPRITFPETTAASQDGECVRHAGAKANTVAFECDALISSGSLVPIATLADVGGMDESLFIDQVDTEWCLRARAKGYKVFKSCTAILEHRLGETYRRIWFGRWRRLPRHKPFRYYYIFRNTLLLCRRSYVPLRRTLFDLAWLVALFFMYGVFTSERNGELRMMLRGTIDGIRGVTGKLQRP
jgi:rhamnosyltransferase